MDQAEVVAIGTELTSGAKLDTNSQWLSLQLSDLGIPVAYHTTVADDPQANLSVLEIAVNRADLIIITGGLGPTLDDLTREVMAKLAGVDLVLHEPSLAAIEGFFKSRNRTMPERNRIQAMFPAGSSPLANPIGTAPGIWMEVSRRDGTRSAIAALPGVPSEMFRMFHEQVRPRLPGGKQVIRRARIHCFGLGESHTEELLGDLTARGRDPEIGITAHEATITLRIIAHGESEAECQHKIQTAGLLIRDRLGAHVFGAEEEELEDVLLQLLAQRGLTLSTMEQGTQGQLAHSLAAAEHRRRQRSLRETGTAPEPCFQSGAVTTAHASEPGQGTKRETDYLLYVGAARQQETAGQPPVTWTTIRLQTPGDQAITCELAWSGNPAIYISRTAKSALDLLRRVLQGTDLSPYQVTQT